MKTARILFIVFIVFLVAHSKQAQAKSQFFQAGIFQKNTTRVQNHELITKVDLTGNRYGITFAVIEMMLSMKQVMAATEILSIKNLLKKPYPASFIQ